MLKPIRTLVSTGRLLAALLVVASITVQEAPAEGAAGGPAALAGVTHRLDSATINTYDDWDGDNAIYGFGKPYVATAGEVITVPNDQNSLMRYRFYVKAYDNDAPLKVRGEVYEWDGTKAVGPSLWEGNARQLNLAFDHYVPMGFRVGGLELTAGRQYVLFMSISKTWHASQTDVVLLAITNGSSYLDGTFEYMDNGNHESFWTTKPWQEDQSQDDLVVKAWFD